MSHRHRHHQTGLCLRRRIVARREPSRRNTAMKRTRWVVGLAGTGMIAAAASGATAFASTGGNGSGTPGKNLPVTNVTVGHHDQGNGSGRSVGDCPPAQLGGSKGIGDANKGVDPGKGQGSGNGDPNKGTGNNGVEP